MILSSELTSQCIIIAGNQPGFTSTIKQLLRQKGFENLKLADSGKKVYETVRSMAEFSDQMGLMIVHHDLQGCKVDELCKAFSCSGQYLDIPIIIIGKQGSEWQAKHGLSEDCLVYNLFESYTNTELIALVELFLTLKEERSRQSKNQERLIDELAERKILDAKVRYLSEHDELTSLLTRSSLENKLALILQRNNDINRNGALLYIDLDRFGLINELEGFAEGDRLIVEVVALVRKTIRSDYLFARLGYDKYCIYIDNISPDTANKIAERVRQALVEFRFISGVTCYNLTVALGLAMVLSEKLAWHPEDLISRSRQASEIGKMMGLNQVFEYNVKDSRIQQKNNDIQWLPLIREALLEDRFFLEFQPVVDLKTGGISHYEVLVRMRTPLQEVVQPADFIGIAERVGLVHSIDIWVVENAIEFLDNLPHSMDYVSLAINLSSQAIQHEQLFKVIKQQLENSRVNPARISFEITETAVIENFEQARKMILNLKSLGCRFALDDFGTGFCSFNYLRSFPIDYLKIDGQFIDNIESDETDQVLVKAMSDIANKLGLTTIAEHIQTPGALAIVKQMGIHLGQGHLFALPESEIKENDVLDFVNTACLD